MIVFILNKYVCIIDYKEMCVILKEATTLERGFELAETHCLWILRGLCAAFLDNRDKQMRNQLSLPYPKLEY